jgi:hypothetical protein
MERHEATMVAIIADSRRSRPRNENAARWAAFLHPVSEPEFT